MKVLAASMLAWLATFAPPAPAQQTGDLNCGDFGSVVEANRVLFGDPSDPNGLDADEDGVACEDELPPGGEVFSSGPSIAVTPEEAEAKAAAGDTKAAAKLAEIKKANARAKAQEKAEEEKRLPSTGGGISPDVAALAGLGVVLVVVGGLLAPKSFRRRAPVRFGAPAPLVDEEYVPCEQSVQLYPLP